ncbi:hypothetical protein PHYSODRAFT_325602 [Phytophthora sojae]|uniref:Uncharacterized protein n=1 Tax=Phytophthora sojae (strain P6497) TaxID=1094619 RepID=G4YWZ0_PHYSP|nr:hypothetical protein PHYSODRAFT_325602 [Phytophthora sojae]EGZ24488.1 hypothetical protein PHYSODRAFT_325602 [Phytophthora sojae]|eukprot:XP_009519776.1 hypothetical protein PHYSODRAFT_325602 [Phytophthora sojae]
MVIADRVCRAIHTVAQRRRFAPAPATTGLSLRCCSLASCKGIDVGCVLLLGAAASLTRSGGSEPASGAERVLGESRRDHGESKRAGKMTPPGKIREPARRL